MRGPLGKGRNASGHGQVGEGTEPLSGADDSTRVAVGHLGRGQWSTGDGQAACCHTHTLPKPARGPSGALLCTVALTAQAQLPQQLEQRPSAPSGHMHLSDNASGAKQPPNKRGTSRRTLVSKPNSKQGRLVPGHC